MKDKDVKEILRRLDMLDNKISNHFSELRREFLKSQTKWFDEAIQFIMNNGVVPGKEIEGKWSSFSSTWYRERFKEYCKSFNIFCIKIPARGFPEVFIHAKEGSNFEKFKELWGLFLNEGGINFETLLKTKKVKEEDRIFFIEICKKYFKKYLLMDDYHITKKSRV